MRRIGTFFLATLLMCGAADARSKGGFSGGSKGFSSGSKSFSSGSSSKSVFSSAPSRPATAPTTSFKGFSAPASKASEPVRPPVASFDSVGARAQAEKASQDAFRASQERARATAAPREPLFRSEPRPQPSVATVQNRTTSGDGRVAANNNSAPVANDNRSRTIVIERTVNGGMPDWYWIWLLSNQNQNNRSRDEWLYHNQSTLSPAQMQELRSKDVGLEERLRKLESEGLKRDPNAPIPEEAASARPAVKEASSGGSSFLLWAAFAILASTVIFLVFVRGTPTKKNRSMTASPQPADRQERQETLMPNVFNPLGFTVGGYVRIETVELMNATFQVVLISEFTRQVGKRTLRFVDYALHDPHFGDGEGTYVTLRALPQEDRSNKLVLWRPKSEFGFSDEFMSILNEPELRDDESGLTYQKVGAFEAQVRELSEDGLNTLSLKYWDFVNTEGKEPRFFLVEMDTSDREGWTQTYTGSEVSVDDVKSIAGNTSKVA